MASPILKSEKIVLRRLRRSDVESLTLNANNKNIARFIPGFPSPYTVEHARSWIDKTNRLYRKGTEIHFGICDIESDAIIGMVGFKNINCQSLNAEVGYWVGRKYWKRGIASEGLRLISGYAFGELKLHRIYAIVSSKNIASVRVLEKAGFLREACWREAHREGGRWFDVYSHGILKREFIKRQRR